MKTIKKLPENLGLRFCFTGWLVLLAFLLIVGGLQAQSQDGTWGTSSSNSNWGTASRWVDNQIAEGAGSTANFARQNTANFTITVANDDGTERDVTIGHLITGNLNNSNAIKFIGMGSLVNGVFSGSKIIFDNDFAHTGEASTWEIVAGSNNVLTDKSVIQVKAELANDLIVKNNSDSDANGLSILTNHTAGTKWVINEGTGTGSFKFGYVSNTGYAANSLTGDIGFKQESETSKLVLSSHTNLSSSFTGGLVWDKGDVDLGGTQAIGLGGDFVISAVERTLGIIANTTLKNNIYLNTDIFIDSSLYTLTFANIGILEEDKTKTVVSGDRILTVTTKDTTYNNAITLNKVMGAGVDDSLTLKGVEGVAGALKVASGTDPITLGGTLTIDGVTLYVYNGSINADVVLQKGSLYLSGWTNVKDFTLNGGVINGTGSLRIQQNGTFYASEGTIDVSLANVDGLAPANLVKNGSGTTVLNKDVSYTGTTIINGGKLIMNGNFSAGGSGITVNAGGELSYNGSNALVRGVTLNGNGSSQRATLSGTATINQPLVLDNIGDTLSPGNSPGIMAFNYYAGQTWDSFTYEWETNDFTVGAAGTNFDQIAITNGLTLSLTGDYVLDIISLDGTNVAGDVQNFSESDRDWVILTTTTGITNFDASRWTLITDHFTSSPNWNGNWSLSQSGNNLVLSYTAVPEPGTLWLMGSVMVGGFFLLMRRRRNF